MEIKMYYLFQEKFKKEFKQRFSFGQKHNRFANDSFEVSKKFFIGTNKTIRPAGAAVAIEIKTFYLTYQETAFHILFLSIQIRNRILFFF